MLLPPAGVERAVRARRDQCHRESMSLYGDIFDLGDGESTLDPGLETGHLEATYPMVRRDGRQSGASGRSRSRWSSRSAR